MIQVVLLIIEIKGNQFVSGSGYGVNLFPLFYIFGKIKAFLLKKKKSNIYSFSLACMFI